MPHWRRFAWQATALPCLRARCKHGIKIDISRAITAITTSSSINVNAFCGLAVPGFLLSQE